MKPAVQIIGVGNMGGGMALNLLARGYAVLVHDIDASKVENLCQKGALNLLLPGIECAPNAIDLIVNNSSHSEVNITIICVVDAAQTQDVLFGEQGVSSWAKPGHTVMLCPTISPQDVEKFAAQLASLGIDCIDAPMSGGPARAQDGSMSLMIACKEAVFTRHDKLLRDLSSKLFRISEQPGDGARTKLVNNLLAASNLAAAAEALALADRLGLDLHKTLDVIEQSSGQSWIGSERMRRAIADDFSSDLAPRAHMTLLAKDSKLANEMAREVDFTPQVGSQAQAIFAHALQAGLSEQDDSALFHWLSQKPPIC